MESVFVVYVTLGNHYDYEKVNLIALFTKEKAVDLTDRLNQYGALISKAREDYFLGELKQVELPTDLVEIMEQLKTICNFQFSVENWPEDTNFQWEELKVFDQF